MEALKVLLTAGASVNLARAREGAAPLHLAARDAHTAVMQVG